MFCSLVAISVVLSLEVLLCTVVSRVREVRFARRERKLELFSWQFSWGREPGCVCVCVCVCVYTHTHMYKNCQVKWLCGAVLSKIRKVNIVDSETYC